MFFLQGLQSAYFFWFTGCKNKNHGALLKELMQTSNFRVTVVEEYDVVEICGALKVSSQCRICLLATRLQNMDSHLDFNTGLFMVSRTNDYFCALSKSHTKQSRGILSLVPVFFFPPTEFLFHMREIIKWSDTVLVSHIRSTCLIKTCWSMGTSVLKLKADDPTEQITTDSKDLG